MGDNLNLYFDLLCLLRLQRIDIHKAARFNMDILAGEYFALLTKFLDKAPSFKENLEKIAALNMDECNYNTLENAKNLLEAIGCEQFMNQLSEIIRVSKRGNKDFAAKEAKIMINEIDNICAEIKSAQKEKVDEDMTGFDVDSNTNNGIYDTQILYKVLRIIELEESTRKMRILAVDDAPIILKTIASVLGDEYKVYELSNPALVEKFLKQITPELFLLDYLMPEINGFELVPIIRSFEEHKKTPIIFLTSSGVKEHISTALKLGACDYIVKPFQGQQLREKIAKHIVRKKLI